MKSMHKKQNGFSAIEAVLILVIVAMIGFTGWYVWHAKQSADKTLTADSSSTPSFKKKSSTQSSTAKIPDGWVWYEGNGFKFAYPKAYGNFSKILTDSPNVADYSSSKPNPVYIEGSTDHISVSIIDKGVAFGTVKYGPSVKFVNGELIVTEVNPADKANIVGKSYKGFLRAENVTQQNGDLKIYILNGSDEGSYVHRYAFELSDKDVVVSVPSFYDGVTMMCPDSGCKANDKTAYETFSSELLDSITKK